MAVTGKPDLSHWKRVVELILVSLREVRIAEEYMWQAVVLIPKRVGDYRGIDLFIYFLFWTGLYVHTACS